MSGLLYDSANQMHNRPNRDWTLYVFPLAPHAIVNRFTIRFKRLLLVRRLPLVLIPVLAPVLPLCQTTLQLLCLAPNQRHHIVRPRLAPLSASNRWPSTSVCLRPPFPSS